MNGKEKKAYLARYKEAKEKGVPFFPDIIFKDAIVSLLVFVILVALAYFVGVQTEARANPADTSYTPRPEWYFLFLFQLLKYFPGKMEVIGVIVIPTLVIALLLALPFFDRSPRRFFLNRPFASLSALILVAGIGSLTILAVRESPPPQVAVVVDQAANLYAKNCSNCHGPSITVPPGTDLHKLIAGGSHAGMPAWGADLSTDEIDALAGFILSPKGSLTYTQQCGTCHKQMVNAAGNPVELQRVLSEGPNYPPHKGQIVPNWAQTLSSNESDALLNFLAAPDGQRLFAINCSGCHGLGVSFSGTESQLRDIISKGGQHLSMPAWSATLSATDLNTLGAYVVNPAATPAGKKLFDQHCSTCHGNAVPKAPDLPTARKVISSGGPHISMPVWGNVLTPEMLDALVKYALDSSQGLGGAEGAKLFANNCAVCHGQYGEGGPNPSHPSETIVPISSAEFLKTRDDLTLRNIISQGQPNFGMSPFGSAFGGPLDATQMDAIVAFLRNWESNPPVELPAKAAAPVPAPLTGSQIFTDTCARCHGAHGEGGIGPAFNTVEFQDRFTDQALLDAISQGREATPMIAWGQIFTPDQLQQLVTNIRGLKPAGPGTIGTPVATPSFSGQIFPILTSKCSACHNQETKLGGWDASTFSSVTTSGKNGSVIIPGDTSNSILVKKLLGAQGGIMPPSGSLPADIIQLVLDWINAGVPNN
jgi:mono/diheme cytochrome c family protein